MIFYKNKKKHRTVKEKDLVFSVFQNGVETDKDDSILDANVCKNAYNLTFSDGALKTGLGFEDLKVPATLDDLETTHTINFGASMDEIHNLWLDRWFNTNTDKYYYQLLLIDEDNVLWGVILPDEFEGFIWKRCIRLQSKPTFGRNYRIDNEDSSIFFSQEGMVYLSYTTDAIYDNVPPIISCVVHYDNFFGITNTNRNTLVYTTNLNLTEWDDEQSSTIEFLDERGSFTKLISFNDYVYLFREYGITKISLYSSKSSFSFTHLYTSSSKIFEESVCVCNDVVVFATRDGLYRFNGSSVTKIFDSYDDYIKNFDNTNCTSACLNGKYYLATKCNFQDGQTVGCESSTYVNNVLFEFDLDKDTVNILRGVDVRDLLAIDTPFMNKLCACFYNSNKQKVGELNYSGKVFTTINKKFWQSAYTDLGEYGKRKKIKEIILTTKYDIEVEVISDEESKTYKIFGKENEQRIQFCVFGKQFKFIFKTDEENCEIRKPVVVFDVLS